VLLEAWRAAESSFGAAGDVAAVENKLPRKIKMRRMVTAPDGSELGLEVGVLACARACACASALCLFLGPVDNPSLPCPSPPFPPSFTRW